MSATPLPTLDEACRRTAATKRLERRDQAQLILSTVAFANGRAAVIPQAMDEGRRIGAMRHFELKVAKQLQVNPALQNWKERSMSGPPNSAAWARFAKRIPNELTKAGWSLWAAYGDTNLFGKRPAIVVLHKDLDSPLGVSAMGEGATEEEALNKAIRQALTLDKNSRPGRFAPK